MKFNLFLCFIWNISHLKVILSYISKNLNSRIFQTSHLKSTTSIRSLNKFFQKDDVNKLLFVGGKGGVGKTTSSSAIAIKLADSGFKTLIVSTDPAHSLGDAFDIKLPKGKLTSLSTDTNLWGLEMDVQQSLDELKDNLAALDISNLSSSLGLPSEFIESLGLNDIANILSNPPPGIDEIISLSTIVKYGNKNNEIQFDRIVIDTAPTGHTIRLLQLPKFVNNLAVNLIRFRSKLLGAVSTFQSMFGNENSSAKLNQLNDILAKLENLQDNMTQLISILKDSTKTEFVVVTIPTTLAVAESKKLISSLKDEGIKTSTILCNQVIPEDSGMKYLETRKRAQTVSIANMQNFLDVTREPSRPKIEITQVPYFDTEVVGIYGLKFFSKIAHPLIAKSFSNPIASKKLTIFGGKGGVGKTTSSAAWAVQLCDAGLKTLIVSTDPAHSLGDAFNVKLTETPLLLESSGDGGQCWAMEIDPTSALEEFKQTLSGALETFQENKEGSNSMASGMLGSLGLGDIGKDLKGFVGSITDPPPGTDEIVALSKVINYLEDGFMGPNGKVIFDRIVLDTAPTGHTLRMLSMPDFLIEFIGKVKSVLNKTSGILGGSSQPTSNDQSKLSKFEKNMEVLDAMIHSPKDTEFVIVTIPTEVAVAETKRLVQSLDEESVFTRRILINQILPDRKNEIKANDEIVVDQSVNYFNQVRKSQSISMKELETLESDLKLNLIKVPYFDTELRSIYGLRFIGDYLVKNLL